MYTLYKKSKNHRSWFFKFAAERLHKQNIEISMEPISYDLSTIVGKFLHVVKITMFLNQIISSFTVIFTCRGV